MSRQKPTHEEVARWIALNGHRVKCLRLLTDADIGRRMGCGRTLVTRLFSDKWHGSKHTRWLLWSLKLIVDLCNALDMTPAELLSRPDDMSLTRQDGRKLAPELARKKKKLKEDREQAEKQALLESLGLDV